jgi:ketosteroid isomerase-like protein
VPTPSSAEVFKRIWALYAAGRGPEILEHLDPDVEWLPALVAPTSYRGHEGVREWARASRRAWKSVTVVLDGVREVDGCLIAAGRISTFDHRGDRVVDTPLACVAEFRDGRVARAASFLSEDEALAWVSERPALP